MNIVDLVELEFERVRRVLREHGGCMKIKDLFVYAWRRGWYDDFDSYPYYVLGHMVSPYSDLFAKILDAMAEKDLIRVEGDEVCVK